MIFYKPHYNLQTLDLDKIDKHQLERILAKIDNCPFQASDQSRDDYEVRDTQKGYHVIIYCPEGCDNCRFVFDDPRRYGMDFKRPSHLTNVLFEPFSAHKVKK